MFKVFTVFKVLNLSDNIIYQSLWFKGVKHILIYSKPELPQSIAKKRSNVMDSSIIVLGKEDLDLLIQLNPSFSTKSVIFVVVIEAYEWWQLFYYHVDVLCKQIISSPHLYMYCAMRKQNKEIIRCQIHHQIKSGGFSYLWKLPA